MGGGSKYSGTNKEELEIYTKHTIDVVRMQLMECKCRALLKHNFEVNLSTVQ